VANARWRDCPALAAKRQVIFWPKVGERALRSVEDALDAGGAWYEQQLAVLGLGDELSGKDPADGFGVEYIKTPEIEDHTFGGGLESICKTTGEAVHGGAAEVSEEFDPDRVPRLGDAYLKAIRPISSAGLRLRRAVARSAPIKAPRGQPPRSIPHSDHRSHAAAGWEAMGWQSASRPGLSGGPATAHE
jgi:hypothetical protein